MTTKEKEEKKENFQEWLFVMDDTLDEFKNIFKKEENVELDFSPASLDTVEQWILKNYDTKEELLKQVNKPVLNMLAVYVGETFRKNIGGKWELDIENEKSAYFQLPILTDSPKISSPIAPHTLVTACISRNKGNYISTILRNKI
ncbi:hypothetical protein [Sinomicrobium sp. M5D2P17]